MKIYLGRYDAYVWAKFRVLILRDNEKFKVLVHIDHVAINVNKRLACFYRVVLFDQGINYEVNLLTNIFN